MTWQDQRACAGADPRIFFPGRGDFEAVEKAKAVCAGCTVREACLDYSLTISPRPPGVWGGLSERERRKLRQSRRPVAA